AHEVGGGTAASCSGRAQVCEGLLDPLNIRLIVEGLSRHQSLEEELGCRYDWRMTGLFLIIRAQSSREAWLQRAAALTANGIPTEVVDRETLQKAEPNMNAAGLLGAVYAREGALNPLKFSLAYAAAARRRGAVILGHSPVTGFERRGRRIVAVCAREKSFSCDKVAVMTGAWMAETVRLADVNLPVRFTHAEAMVTERIPRMIFNNVEISDFYETIHGKRRAVAIGVHPQLDGSVAVSESVTQTPLLDKRVSAWGLTALAKALADLYPFMKKARVVRAWGRPTSFTPDGEALVGWLPQFDNLFVAGSLVETITVVPVLSEWIAAMMTGGEAPYSLNQFSPARFFS
ncbi:MAG: FAD-binding oxidoreductase, partial [Chloroflexi bacterium]|nr:FAD-binding oxidoreductase [Chloroflexota bacterium]